MDTQVINIENQKNFDFALEEAYKILVNGELVGLPTETVYGLAANAFDENAVKKIYSLKNRPSDNPLILHVANSSQVLELVDESYFELVMLIAKNFWPGALTIVVPKSKKVPHWLTKGLDTIAVRIPDSKIMRELALKLNSPIAAPSANISGRPSPTHAKHVLQDFDGRLKLIIDNGATTFGLESTVIDISDPNKILQLRPGAVSLAELNKLFIVEVLGSEVKELRSPGLKYKHYAPSCKVKLVTYTTESDLSRKLGTLTDIGNSLVVYNKNLKFDFKNCIKFSDTSELSKNLFDIFRSNENKFSQITILYPAQDKDLAIYNRLEKAAEE